MARGLLDVDLYFDNHDDVEEVVEEVEEEALAPLEMIGDG